MSDETICAGCAKPIEADERGVRSYSLMMRLDGGPADPVHTDAACKRLYEIAQRKARIASELDAIARLTTPV